jgi:hypothetical protein
MYVCSKTVSTATLLVIVRYVTEMVTNEMSSFVNALPNAKYKFVSINNSRMRFATNAFFYGKLGASPANEMAFFHEHIKMSDTIENAFKVANSYLIEAST